MSKTAAIIGYGKSGAAAARILKLQGYNSVDFYDDRKEGCKPIATFTDSYDMTVVSPGVPLNTLPVVPDVYTSEIDLAWSELPEGSIVLGVTGTNGKSTVTHLAAQILNNAGLKAVACGNIGYPFADAVLDKKADVYVVELSSFQIELIHDLRLAGAVLINLTPDHLDRYASYDDYVQAKLGIINFIEPDGVFITDPDPFVVNKVLRAPYTVRYVDSELKGWPELQGTKLVFSGDGYYVDTSDFKLFGWHNLLNLSFALGLASVALQGERKLTRNVTHVIHALTGMPHRTETVLVHKGVTWINDSKATNVDSTLIALKSCKYPAIVLLGGKDKKGDFTLLVEELNRVASLVVIFGAAAELIYKQLEGKLMCPMIKIGWLREAVELAHKEARIDGYTVILSPACASYDEFNNFEERGLRFAQYVKEVTDARS